MIRIEISKDGEVIKAAEAQTEAEALKMLGLEKTNPYLKIPDYPKPEPWMPYRIGDDLEQTYPAWTSVGYKVHQVQDTNTNRPIVHGKDNESVD